MKRILAGVPLLRGLELPFLLLLSGLAVVVWAFLSIGGEMVEGETRAFDHRLLLLLRMPRSPAGPKARKSFALMPCVPRST